MYLFLSFIVRGISDKMEKMRKSFSQREKGQLVSSLVFSTKRLFFVLYKNTTTTTTTKKKKKKNTELKVLKALTADLW